MTDHPVPRHAPAARPRRAFAGLAAVVALLLTMASPGAVFAWDANSYSAADEQLLVTLTNQSRAAAGMAALPVDPALTDMARWRSRDMIDRDYFSHGIPPDGKKVFDYLSSSGYCYVVAGENIGTNNFPDDTATATIHQGFMASAGHRANILGSGWDVIGIGAYKGADGRHMWTVLFADRCNAAPTPAPTPKPTAAPTATPARTPAPTATPKPTAAPSLAPTPVPTTQPTATPGPTPVPSPSDTPEPTLGPTSEPTEVTPAPSVDVIPTSTPSGRTPDPTGSADEPGPSPTDAPATPVEAMRVVDPPFASGLVDRIVGDVAAGFFGN